MSVALPDHPSEVEVTNGLGADMRPSDGFMDCKHLTKMLDGIVVRIGCGDSVLLSVSNRS